MSSRADCEAKVTVDLLCVFTAIYCKTVQGSTTKLYYGDHTTSVIIVFSIAHVYSALSWVLFSHVLLVTSRRIKI